MAKVFDFKREKEIKMQTKIANDIDTLTSIEEIAKAFLSMESMTHKKLQKLCYYAYSWFFTLYNKHLFINRFEAWIHGPVDPVLYQTYREWGWQEIPQENDVQLTSDIYNFVKQVFISYGHLSGDELEYLTHMEEPWKQARGDKDSLEPSNELIKDDVIRNFYLKVLEDEQRD